MANEKRKPSLDLQVCYSGFKVEELEYIGYSRTNEDHEDDFLDTFAGKLDDGVSSEDENEEEILGLGGYVSSNFSDGYRSYLCSTPTAGRKHRGSFPQDADMSGFPEPEYGRNFPSNVDSGLQSQTMSAANSLVSIFGDQNGFRAAGSLESLPGSSRVFPQPSATRKRIELDSDVYDPYSNVDEMELSIEEEMSHVSQGGNTTTLGTLKRRLSFKVIRRNISTGLFGSYMQRVPALPSPSPSASSNQLTMTSDHSPLLNNKPTGPVNLWFRKFRNRHFI